MQQPNFATLKLLVLDDESRVWQAIEQYFVGQFAAMRWAGGAREGLRVAADFRPDIIVLDLDMPGGMTGLDFAAKWKITDQRQAYVVYTSFRGGQIGIFKRQHQGSVIGLAEAILGCTEIAKTGPASLVALETALADVAHKLLRQRGHAANSSDVQEWGDDVKEKIVTTTANMAEQQARLGQALADFRQKPLLDGSDTNPPRSRR